MMLFASVFIEFLFKNHLIPLRSPEQ